MCIEIIDVNISFLAGTEVKLTNSAPFAVFGRPFNFTCTVTGANTFNDDVCFHWGHFTKCYVQSETGCVVNCPEVSNYICICGAGTKDTSSSKNYILKIKHTSYKETGDWKCELRKEKIVSSLIPLEVRGEYRSVSYP